jgi:hypothetical protein
MNDTIISSTVRVWFVLPNIIIPIYHIMFISNDELNGNSIL